MSRFMLWNDKDLLRANGNRWKVLCWKDGNRSKLKDKIYVQCPTRSEAEQIASKRSGCRTCYAFPWNPLDEPDLAPYIRLVEV